MYVEIPHKRYNHSLDFIKKHLNTGVHLLDLGVRNPFTEILKNHGFKVLNTTGQDLDLEPESVKDFEVDAVVALEILEHLVSPMNVLKNLPSDNLIATVPLDLWFAKAYRSAKDPWDRHYHEFEDWQFDWLLEKSGWKVEAYEKWTSPVKKIGFRPILRRFVPRYYAVYARRVK